MASKSKRKLSANFSIQDETDLFSIDKNGQKADDNDDDTSDADSTDSEESVYSGLENDEESDEESVESFEEAKGSDESDEEDDEEEDMSEGTEESEGSDESENDDGSPLLKPKQKKQQSNSNKKSKGVNGTRKAQVSVIDTPSTSQEPEKNDEYEFDSSDEEDIRNTVGNIPIKWYDEYDHIGYDLTGSKIFKPKKGDELDEFLNKMDNPDYWRTVKDKSTGQNVVLSDKDVELIQRLRKGKHLDPSQDMYAPWVDMYSHEVMQHPMTNRPEHKRSFIPSKWERLKVGKLVHAMKMGWIKPKPPKTEEDEDKNKFYELWQDDQSDNKRFTHHIPAPKMSLPGHEESYNPPPEYLFTEEEEMAWKDKDPEDRRINFIPQKNQSLRQTPAYSRFINERFERCLDLYLCPRQRRMRMNVDVEDLIPKLPKPKDLQPFPMVQSLLFSGHDSLVRSISPDPTGQWLVSGSDDKTIKLWEVATGRCMRTIEMGGLVKFVTWTPNASLSMVAAVVDNDVVIFNPLLGDKLVIANTDNMLESYQEDTNVDNKLIDWTKCNLKEQEEGLRIRIPHPKPISQISWHGRGDYFAVVMPEGDSMSVLIHQLSKRRTQNPLKKPKGLIQKVCFHPTKPFLFVATQRYVRVYNLLKQELTKKLMTNCKWVSSMAVHPGGDNVIIGSYDCKLSWFDMDLSTKPYQTLKNHKRAIRQVCYHNRYPLFASASDDGTIIICHGMVFGDLLQNPLIVPVKILRGHKQTKELGVLDCAFHPTQPWIFSSGSDSTIRLWS